MERLGDGEPDHAQSDQSHHLPFEAGHIVGEHSGAEYRVIARFDFGVRPRETAQQQRRRGQDVLGDRAIAAARHVGHRDAVRRRRIDRDHVQAGAVAHAGAYALAVLENVRRQVGAHDDCICIADLLA